MATSVVSWTIRTRALVVSGDSTPATLCQRLDLDHLIRPPDPGYYLACEWQHRDISLHELIRPQPGAGLTLNFEPIEFSRPLRTADPILPDANSFVQLPLREDTHSSSAIAAAAEESWEVFEQDLSHRSWQSLTVAVWYISHDQHAMCHCPREVRLRKQEVSWQQQLVTAWQDHIVPDDPIFITVARPVARCPIPHRPQLILWQHPREQRVVGLAATVAEPFDYRTVQLVAVSIPSSLSVAQLLTQSSWDHHLFRPGFVWYLHAEWRPHEWLAFTDGACWTVILQSACIDVPPVHDSGPIRMATPVSDSDHETPADAVELVQTKMRYRTRGQPRHGAKSEDQVPPPQPRTVLLAPALSQPETCREQAAFRAYDVPGLEDLSLRLLEHRVDLTIALPRPEALPACHAQALWDLQSQAQYAWGRVVHIELFTDGSHCPKSTLPPAWAFVVVYHFESGHQEFQGFAAGSLTDGSLIKQCVHGDLAAFDAETTALCFALLWIINCNHFVEGVPVTIIADAWSALECASGGWTAHSHPYLADFVRPLWQAVSQMGHLSGRWQKAHSGFLFNDLADHIARHYASKGSVTVVQDPLRDSDRLAIAWLWLFWKSQLDPFGPQFFGEQLQLKAPPPCQDADLPCWPQHERVQPRIARINLHCTTYNAGTLKGWSAKGPPHAWTSKAELLFQQLTHQHCVCLQETRRTQDRPWSTSGWCGFAGPAKQGQGGVEIWLNTSLPFAWLQRDGEEDLPVCFSQKGIDYPLWPCQWIAADFHAQNDTIGLEHQHDDHLSSSVRGILDVRVEAAPTLRATRPDIAQMNTPQGRSINAALVSCFVQQHETCLWNASIDRQAAMVDEWFGKVLPQAFPPQKRPASASWLSHRTIELRQASRQARRQVQRIQAHVRQQFLLCILHHWSTQSRITRQQCDLCVSRCASDRPFHLLQAVFSCWQVLTQQQHRSTPPVTSFRLWLCSCDRAVATHLRRVDQTRKQLHLALQQDEAEHIQTLIADKDAHMSDIRPADFWKKLRPMLPKQHRKNALVKAKYMATDRSFTEHFAEIEHAVIEPLDVLAQSIAAGNRAASEAALHQPADIGDLPTLCELATALQQT
eukprot:Skav220422  [mRNA]  locus=scaffold639:721297:724980:+ [translate_table: standard]